MSSEATFPLSSSLGDQKARGTGASEPALRTPSSLSSNASPEQAEPMADSSKGRLLERASHGSGEFLILPSDESLVGEAAKGSKEATGLLFRRYRFAVVSVARRILKDALEAEDLCQLLRSGGSVQPLGSRRLLGDRFAGGVPAGIYRTSEVLDLRRRGRSLARHRSLRSRRGAEDLAALRPWPTL